MIYLYVSSFGNSTDWIKNAKKIEVGCYNRDILRNRNVLYDDDEINISKENVYFGELTGLFWIWKNIKFEQDDIIGFCHYNKCLDISEKDIQNFFEKHRNNSWIVRKPQSIEKHTYIDDVTTLRLVLEKYYPEYYISWEKLYDIDGSSKNGVENCFCAEMFYVSYNVFCNFCEFLFDVLFKVKDIVGDVERTPYHKRYCAFLGERLLSVYIATNKANHLDVDVKFNENILLQNIRKIGYRFCNRNSLLFRVVRKIIGRKQNSSYIN